MTSDGLIKNLKDGEYKKYHHVPIIIGNHIKTPFCMRELSLYMGCTTSP